MKKRQVVRKCPMCGGREEYRNLKGEAMPYRDIHSLVISEDVMLPRCTKCGEELLDEADTLLLEHALATSYRKFRQEQTDELIAQLTEELGLNQNDIELIAGLSAGYISKVKRSEKVLAAQTYRLLTLLRAMPVQVINILARVDDRIAPLARRVEERTPAGAAH